MKKFFSFAGFSLLIVIVIALSAAIIICYLGSPAAPPGAGPVEVVIEPGWNSRNIARHLEDQGVIRSRMVFRLYIRWREIGNLLHAGTYQLSPSQSMVEITETLRKGVPDFVRLVVPEGYTSQMIGKLLLDKKMVDSDDFSRIVSDVAADLHPWDRSRETLEGVLFPDTYKVAPNEDCETVIRLMVQNFSRKMNDDRLERCEQIKMSLEEVIILASIVEKEARYDSERPLIASVFLNRIKKTMKLESCATVQYVFGTPKARLTYDDLKIESPYNTYLHTGFPPGPICNPGLASIDAVLTPANTGFLYFVLGPDGKHVFSRTLAEHNRTKKRLKRK